MKEKPRPIAVECYKMGECLCERPDLDSYSNCCRFIEVLAVRATQQGGQMKIQES